MSIFGPKGNDGNDRVKAGQTEIIRNTEDGPYQKGLAFGQDLPLASLEKYQGVVKSVALKPDSTPRDKEMFRRAAELMGAMEPFTPADKKAFQGVFSEQAAAGVGRFSAAVQGMKRVQADEHFRVQSYIVGKMDSEKADSINDARKDIALYRENRSKERNQKAIEQVQSAQKAYVLAMDPKAPPATRMAAERDVKQVFREALGQGWPKAMEGDPGLKADLATMREARLHQGRADVHLAVARQSQDDAAVTAAELSAKEQAEMAREAEKRVLARFREHGEEPQFTRCLGTGLNDAVYNWRLARATNDGTEAARERTLRSVLTSDYTDSRGADDLLARLKETPVDDFESQDRALKPLIQARMDFVSANLDFAGMEERAKGVLGDRESANLRQEAVHAGDIRAKAAVGMLFERAKIEPEGPVAKSLEALQGQTSDEAFRLSLEKQLRVLYANPNFEQTDGGRLEAFGLLGSEGGRMWMMAQDGRRPGSTLDPDGSMNFVEARHWLGLHEADSATAKGWKTVIGTLNDSQWSEPGLDPVQAQLQAITEGLSLPEYRRATIHERVERAKASYSAAQVSMIQSTSGGTRDGLLHERPGSAGWDALVAQAEDQLVNAAKYFPNGPEAEVLETYRKAQYSYNGAMAREWADAQESARSALDQAFAEIGDKVSDDPEARRRVELTAAFTVAHPELRAWAQAVGKGCVIEGRVDTREAGDPFDGGVTLRDMTEEEKAFIQSLQENLKVSERGGAAWVEGLRKGQITDEALAGLGWGEGASPEMWRAVASNLNGDASAKDPDAASNPLLAEAMENGAAAKEFDRLQREIGKLDLGKVEDRVKLWRAMDFTNVQAHAKAWSEWSVESLKAALFYSKSAWNSEGMSYVRMGFTGTTHGLIGVGKMVGQVGSGAVGAAQGVIQGLAALAKAQEAGGQGDILAAALQTWDGGLNMGRAPVTAGSAGLGAVGTGVQTGATIREVPQRVRQRIGRSMEMYQRRYQMREKMAETGAKHAKEAAEITYNYTQDFRRAAEIAKEVAMASDKQTKASKGAELKAAKEILAAHEARLNAEFPEIGAIIEKHRYLSMDHMIESLDKIERAVPDRYRAMLAKPHEIAIRVPMAQDRDGHPVPASNHGDAAPVVDLGATRATDASGRVPLSLAAVVEDGKIRFSSVALADPVPVDESVVPAVVELGEIRVGEFERFSQAWNNMVSMGQRPDQAGTYPHEIEKVISDPREREAKKREWDTFRQMKNMGMTQGQEEAIGMLDDFTGRLGGSLRSFNATNPNHRFVQQQINETLRGMLGQVGDHRALGLANTPESEARVQMKSVDGLLSLVSRRTPMEMVAFFNKMILDYTGDVEMEQEDAMAANNEAFGW